MDKTFHCLICEGERSAPMLQKDALRLARCASCGFVQQQPVPGLEEINAAYADEGHYAEEILHAEEAYADRDRRTLQGLADLGAEGPLLDVGAGAGTLLRAARELGWACEGIEISRPNAEGIRKALGVKVHEVTIEDAPIEAGAFGVVTFSHSLEHVPNPVGTLRCAARALREGGLVHVAVPNWKAGKRKVAGKHIPWIYPHHIGYFMKKTLGHALKRAGFEPLAWEVGPFIGIDYPFFLALVRRMKLEGALRRFLRMGDRPLEALIGDDVRVEAPPWRFPMVVRLAHLMLKLWPEGLLCRFGMGEELKVAARR